MPSFGFSFVPFCTASSFLLLHIQALYLYIFLMYCILFLHTILRKKWHCFT